MVEVEEKLVKNPNGHPCSEDCCNQPKLFVPEHECADDEEICESCYQLECDNCGSTCGCEL